MTEFARPPGPSRREFLRLAAAGAIAGAFTPPVAFAQSATPSPASTPAPAPVAPAPEGPSEAARSLTAILQQRLGEDRLTPGQWEAVAKDFDYDLASAKRMAAVKLANGDEPDFAFKV